MNLKPIKRVKCWLARRQIEWVIDGFKLLLASLAMVWTIFWVYIIVGDLLPSECSNNLESDLAKFMQGLATFLLADACLSLASIIRKFDLAKVVDVVIVSIAALLFIGAHKELELLLQPGPPNNLTDPNAIVLFILVIIGVLSVCFLCFFKLWIKKKLQELHKKKKN